MRLLVAALLLSSVLAAAPSAANRGVVAPNDDTPKIACGAVAEGAGAFISGDDIVRGRGMLPLRAWRCTCRCLAAFSQLLSHI
jgi:hypothetical protein